MNEERLGKPPSGMDIYARPQQLVRINRRRRINLHVAGEGPVTVILSAGLAGGNLDWGRVHHRVARFARVVAHEHAGLGFSDSGPLPRSSSAIVSDLRAALERADIPPPYVLVGHSAGGLHMRYFAGRHPQEVTGLVLVDSVTPYAEQRMPGRLSQPQERRLWRRLGALARRGDLVPGTEAYAEHVRVPQPGLTPAVNAAMHVMRTSPAYYRTLISESLELGRRSSREIEALPDLGNLPLVVLSASRVGAEAYIGDGSAERAWYAMHDELKALSTRGVRRMVDCGHNIPVERPEAVVAAIREVLDQAAG